MTCSVLSVPRLSLSLPTKKTHAAGRRQFLFLLAWPGLARRNPFVSSVSFDVWTRPSPPRPVHSCTARRLQPRSLHCLLFSCIVACSVLHGNTPRKTCDRTTIAPVGSLTVALLPRDLHPYVQTCTQMMSIMLNMTTGPDTTPDTTTAARVPPGTDPLTDSPTALRSTVTVTADEPRPSREPTPPLSSPTGTTSASP